MAIPQNKWGTMKSLLTVCSASRIETGHWDLQWPGSYFLWGGQRRPSRGWHLTWRLRGWKEPVHFRWWGREGQAVRSVWEEVRVPVRLGGEWRNTQGRGDAHSNRLAVAAILGLLVVHSQGGESPRWNGKQINEHTCAWLTGRGWPCPWTPW